MADLKKSFDEVKDVATGMSPGNVMTSLQKDVGDALQIADLDKPVDTQVETSIADARDRRDRDADDAGRTDARDLRRGRGPCGGLRTAGHHPRGPGRSRRTSRRRRLTC